MEKTNLSYKARLKQVNTQLKEMKLAMESGNKLTDKDKEKLTAGIELQFRALNELILTAKDFGISVLVSGNMFGVKSPMLTYRICEIIKLSKGG